MAICDNCNRRSEDISYCEACDMTICEACDHTCRPDVQLERGQTREVREYLDRQGWKRFSEGFIDKWGDHYVDLSRDYGCTWELNGFSDSDRDGVATPRWVAKAEGDTLAELKEVLCIS
jgi:hypothetical protein